jgi:peptidyl-tRNA hydrolase
MGRNKWSAEDCVAYGKWLSGLIKSDDKDRHVTEAVIESAYRLGLGPYQKSLAGKFGGKLFGR